MALVSMTKIPLGWVPVPVKWEDFPRLLAWSEKHAKGAWAYTVGDGPLFGFAIPADELAFRLELR